MAKKRLTLRDKQGNAIDYDISAARVTIDAEGKTLEVKLSELVAAIEATTMRVVFNGNTHNVNGGTINLGNQLQPDWAETSTTYPSFIKNKPDVVTGIKVGASGSTITPTNGVVTIPESGGSVDVDNAMSASSDNPVANRVIKAYVDNLINGLINGAPAALDTLNELSAALGNDSNFAATITQQLALKANDADVVKSISVNGQTTQTPQNGNVNLEVPTMTLDETPTAGSNNAVKSGGVYDVLQNYTIQTIPDGEVPIAAMTELIGILQKAVFTEDVSAAIASWANWWVAHYDVTFVNNDGHVSTSGGNAAATGINYVAVLTPDEGCTLTSVAVTMEDGNGVAQDVTSLYYDSTTHTVNIPGSAITGDIVITAVASVNTYSINVVGSNYSATNNASSIQHGSSYTNTIAAATGYMLSSVVVMMGGVDVTSSAYNSSTGVISIGSVTGALSITVSTAALPSEKLAGTSNQEVQKITIGTTVYTNDQNNPVNGIYIKNTTVDDHNEWELDFGDSGYTGGTFATLSNTADTSKCIFYDANNSALKITSVTHIPDMITELGSYCFGDISGGNIIKELSSVNMGANVTHIGRQAFYSSGITSINFNANTTLTGGYGFQYTKISSLYFPTGCVMKQNDFKGCSLLTSVVIDGSTGANSFDSCTALTNVTFGANGKYVKVSNNATPFSECSALNTFTFQGSDVNTLFGESPEPLGSDKTKAITVNVPSASLAAYEAKLGASGLGYTNLTFVTF